MLPTQDIQERLKGGLLKALVEAKPQEEKVWASLEGLSGQAIVLTETQVMILKAGMSAGAVFGQKSKVFRLADITSVEYSCALTEGRIQITTAGSVEHMHGFLQRGQDFLTQVATSRQAENVCQFPSNKKAKFQQMAQLVRERVKTAKESPLQNEATGKPDIPSQIRQLGELVKEGILTQAEFEEKKKELLARL